MKKVIAFLGTALIILGAGCSNPPAASNNNSTDSSDSAPSQPSSNTPPVNNPTTPVVSTTPTPPSPSTSVNITKTYSMADVKAANTPQKCWTVINGKVYDVTAWEKKHPGGEPAILKLCGIDGSSLFNKQHGGQPQPAQALAGFEIGTLKQ